MSEFWNQKYKTEEYIYGKEPNEFLKINLEGLAAGKILFAGEGEGRNSVYAASRGWEVDAVDSSTAGKEKALKLASEKNVFVNYQLADLRNFEFGENIYDAIVLIYLHFSEEDRIDVHKKLISALKPGGIIILEAFEKSQLKNSTGGPQNPDLLYSLENIVADFIDLEFLKFSKTTTRLNEGSHHNGSANIIRLLAKK